MKFKLLIALGFITTMVMAQPKPATPPVVEKPIAVNPQSKPVTAPQPQVGFIIPGNLAGAKPQQQVGGANTQPGDGRTLQSSSQTKEQFLVSPRAKNGTSGRAESAIENKKEDIKVREQYDRLY